MSKIKALGAVVLCALLSACGGGGSGKAGVSPFFPVVDTHDEAAAIVTAADIVLETSKAAIANTGSDSIAVTVTALNGSRSAIGNAAVRLTVDGDAIISANEGVTDASGKLLATLTIGANKANRIVTISATSGSTTRTARVQVIGAKLSATLVPAVVAPGASGSAQFRLLDQAGNAMSDQAIRVTAPSLAPAEAAGRTDLNGNFEFQFTAPSTPGSYPISVTAGGATLEPPPTLQVQAVSSTPPVTAPIASASVSANPSVIGTNAAGASNNRTEIRALFLTSNNQPLANVRVKFDLAGDANSIGGTFSTGTATLYSDANGVASTAYIPGTRSSPTNGVTVRACYYADDASASAGACATNARVTLTVTSEPLGVSIGTDNTIEESGLTYVKKFVVSVVDSAGVAKPDVNLVVSLDLPHYFTGDPYTFSGTSYSRNGALYVCSNEDVNRNGVLETGEDQNVSRRLEPGKSDVSVSLLQSKTRADGTAELQIQYAKSFATWVGATITVAASGVLGTEGRASFNLPAVPALASALATQEVPPPFVTSPYPPYAFQSSCSLVVR